MVGQLNAVNADRPCNVLDGLFAHIFKIEAEFVAHLIVHDPRHHNATGRGERLQPCRNVDAVPVDIVVIADDIADIDAYAELDAALGWHLGIALNHATLNIDRATHRVDDADKFHQHAVARSLDDPAPVLSDLRIN